MGGRAGGGGYVDGWMGWRIREGGMAMEGANCLKKGKDAAERQPVTGWRFVTGKGPPGQRIRPDRKSGDSGVSLSV